MNDDVDLDFIESSVTIYRAADGGVDLLREFSAEVALSTEEGPKEIGSVCGWIGWNVRGEDVHDAADAISTDAETLGAAAAAIMDNRPDAFVDTVLLIDRMHLDPDWRGRRLSGAIIDDLLSLLRLDPETTAVVLQPEPQRPEGGPMADGPERAAALARLQAAYRLSGLEPWDGSVVWWRPL
jgi:hypothetical protein